MTDPAFIHDSAWLLISLLITVLGYAEIHFRFAGLKGYLFKKEPEIVFDLPFRSTIGTNIPLFLFIKDANEYPVKLLRMITRISAPQQSYQQAVSENLNLPIREAYFSRVFVLPANFFPTAGSYEIDVELTYETNGRTKKLHQDNYRSISHEPLEIHISGEGLPLLEGWHWGDLHVHSNFTEDQVEFGAPIAETMRCAQSVGLRFLAITDHSFDLEDAGEEAGLEPNSSSPKWTQFMRELHRLQAENGDILLLPGEEVSTGNHRNQNVHCLLIGNARFYPGNGDGARILFRNNPTLSLTELLAQIQTHENHTIVAAAHPGDIPPQSQKFVLNRGHWNDPDLLNLRIDYWQILNGKLDRFFLNSLERWKAALLNEHRIGILAGTDAHGNFNCFRQIKTPLLKMVKHRYQLLGLTRTAVWAEGRLDREKLLDALRKKRVVISNGPIMSIEITRGEELFRIGDETVSEAPFVIRLQAKSSPEFGALQKIYLYNGSFGEKKERLIVVEIPDRTYAFETNLDGSEKIQSGYIRAEVYTDNGEGNHFCLTNPIWIR